ncbi:MAG: HepT-like ribonuclease domain-containing protein [Tunicatimonas sp.]|uniref:HepT-like ribonuclease domain-containing protein n=1 Tax=Tunicatimonas sp. TaxID=1940096 RepID=UPI003C756B44
MPPKEILKYILDIESAIEELDEVVNMYGKDYRKFSSNFMAVRTVERDLEIIGEAVRKLIEIDPSLKISSSKQIIGLRNMIVHAYDAIDPTMLWRILLKDLPLLKNEIRAIKG